MGSELEPSALVKPDELVVDREHLDIVTGELGRLGIWPPTALDDDSEPIKEDEGLGLALLKLPAGLTELDALLWELRHQFSARYGGWAPVMGKNRTVEGIIRAGTSKPMGGGVGVAGTPKPMQVFDPESHAEFVLPPPVNITENRVKVGILDTPFYQHPGLAGYTVHPDPVFEPGMAAVDPRAGHGTFVASRVLLQAPGAELFVRGILGSETGSSDTWDLAVEMVRLAEQVDILNLSCGCFTADGQPPLVLSRAVERLNPRVVVVAAAGNHAETSGWDNGRTSRSPTWPAALPSVVAVGASDRGGQRAPFSPNLPWVSCTAWGVDVPGAYLTGDVLVHDQDGVLIEKPFCGHATWSGTSFAAATVSGAVAAAMRPGKTAREALGELLESHDKNPVVKKFHLAP